MIIATSWGREKAQKAAKQVLQQKPNAVERQGGEMAEILAPRELDQLHSHQMVEAGGVSVSELCRQDWDPEPSSKDALRQGGFDQDTFRVCQDLGRCFMKCSEIPR